VFYEGSFQGRMHRKCAGISHPAFEILGESDTQYLCSHCMLARQNKEISNVANVIKDLKSNIAETITSLQSHVNLQVLKMMIPLRTKLVLITTCNKIASLMWSFMILINVQRVHEHSEHDLSNVAKIITKVDENINPFYS